MNASEREELARLLPFQVEPELPRDRHRHLKEFVMTEIHQDAQPAKPKRRLLRPAVLAPVLAAAAAVAIAAPLALGGGAAYAVSQNDDGTILITINEAKNPKSLQADLKGMGLNAIVDYVPMGKQCSPQPRSQNFLSKEEASLSVSSPPENWGRGFTIDPKVVKDDQVAVLEFSVSEHQGGVVAAIRARVSTGPVADCELVDGPGAPLGSPEGN
ncbi:hypothetical protein OHA77_24750 [Streptosporangium sp. NBC_01639]|uniref:hypothetical protein n=1 Tax=Streptosporangium sp. NBC_01639 TaxID=2975948 RepID=UPI003870D181|nr:hypothetical protein OHA77_24750 [Streptosporangium sp. NBC_01639]